MGAAEEPPLDAEEWQVPVACAAAPAKTVFEVAIPGVCATRQVCEQQENGDNLVRGRAHRYKIEEKRAVDAI